MALVHDYLLVLRGAERTFAVMADCWPRSPVYTLVYDLDALGNRFTAHPLRPSPLQRLGLRQKGFRRMLPLYPWATGQLDVGSHTLVVSSSSAFAHGVRTNPEAKHVCYCHTPFRYAWFEQERAAAELPMVLRPLLFAILASIRRWDRHAADRVTHYVANSRFTQERIARVWNRDSTVVYPPVEVHRFQPGEPDDYLLIVTELVAHKRVDQALTAARRAGRSVKVVGTGPELETLEAAHSDHVEFLGRVDDLALATLYAEAQAVVLTAVEEFGITAVEAQAAGRPVVAPAAGGPLETVVDGETGVLVPLDDPDALAEVLREVDFCSFSPQRAIEQARQFSTDSFRERFTSEVERVVAA